MAGDSTFDVRTVFGLVGGMDAFDRLVGTFYEGVEADPVLRPMYADEDLTASRRRLSMFLAQFFGGPSTYSEERGHPRLRMRHSPFPIDAAARDRWMLHMSRAVEAEQFPEEVSAAMIEYFERAATFLINR